MSKPLAGRTALVTGASRGIGRATALRLARDGALVAAHYGRNRDAAETLVAEVAAAGGEAFALGADLAGGTPAIRGLFADLDAELGRRGRGGLDILVNNAGVAPFVAFDETDEATLDAILAVNVKAAFLVAQEGARRLGEGGRLVNLTTTITRTYFPNVTAYSSSKGFLDVLTRYLAAELGPRGIAVNAIAPGAIDTDMSAWLRSEEGTANAHAIQAFRRVGKPEDVADAIAFLAGADSRWITGEVIGVSGGTKL